MPGHAPGFLGSLYYRITTVTEKWGPLWDRVNIYESPTHTVEYLCGLHKDNLVTKEWQLAVSVLAWPLLMWPWIDLMYQIISWKMRSVVMWLSQTTQTSCHNNREKKTNLTIPLKKVRNISLETTKAPEQVSPYHLDLVNKEGGGPHPDCVTCNGTPIHSCLTQGSSGAV